MLSSIFRQSAERAFDGRLEILLESLIASSDLDADGQITLSRNLSESRFELAYSGWYWQITPRNKDEPLRSRSLWDQSLDIPDAAPREGDAHGINASYIVGPEGKRLRVLERDIMLPGSEVEFAFAVAGDTAETERDIQGFNGMMMGALGVLGVGMLVALLLQVRFGLRPLDHVRRALAAIRAGRATRLDGDFPAEIMPLADEINSLLESNREVLERARTHVGNLAHALKTPLTILANESRINPEDFAGLVRRQAEAMRQQIDHHLARARAAASVNVLGVRTPVAPVVDRLSRALAKIYANRNVEITNLVPADLAFRGETQDLEEVVGNLLDNACKWTRRQVRVSAASTTVMLRHGQPAFCLKVEDDGPGLPEEQRLKAVKRGERLDETVPGSGLGLSIVSEIAGLYGGKLSLGQSDLGGLDATLLLPAAATMPPS